jgi:hypothetical protein
MYISRKKRNAVQANQNSGSRVSLGGEKNYKESASPILELSNWTREDVFSKGYSSRPLEDFTDPCPKVDWLTDNPFLDSSNIDLIKLVEAEVKWRYHHGVAEIPSTTGYYEAYATRVDAMLEMVDQALQVANVTPSEVSFLDIAAAEGYVTNHLLDLGAKDIDAVELSALNIKRMWIIRALKKQTSGRIGRIDLDRVDWSKALGRTYDVTLGLGVIYHMENPMLFARNLYAATKLVAIVESDTPVFPANKRFRGNGNVYLHRDQVTLASDNVRYLSEFRPDRQALVEMLLAAGFKKVDLIAPSTSKGSRYFTSGEKTVVVAYV